MSNLYGSGAQTWGFAKGLTVLFFLFLFLISPRLSADPSNAFQGSLQQALEYFTSRPSSTGSQKCFSGDTQEQVLRGLLVQDLRASCLNGSLFSETPPAWLRGLIASQSSPQSRFALDHWWPLCSVLQLHHYARNQPALPFSSYFNAYRASYYLRDQCSTHSHTHATDRSAPSTTTRIRTLPIPERLRIAAQAINLRDQMKERCCGTSRLCRDIFDHTRVQWCNPQDPQSTPPCPGYGAQFSLNFHRRNSSNNRNTQLQTPEHLWKQAQQQHFITDASIILDPRLPADREGPALTAEILAHEVGHGCDFTTWYTTLQEGSSQGIAATMAHVREIEGLYHNPPDCSLNADRQLIYSGLFQRMGASSETFQCLVRTLSQYPTTRFGATSCAPVCLSHQLREAFADFSALQLINAPERLRTRLQFHCDGIRDAEHPLGADTVSCFLQTEVIYKKATAALGCRATPSQTR